MSVTARRIRATPQRSASEVWAIIADLIAAPGAPAREDLAAASGAAASTIADEVPKEAPIVVAGCGPRLRIYCIYGEDAISGEGSNEAVLSWDPTEGDWMMWLPASKEDLDWTKAELEKRTPRITAYDPEAEEPGDKTQASRAEFSINLETFKRL